MLALMKLGFSYGETLAMSEPEMMDWLKASLPMKKEGKKFLVRKKKGA